MNAVLLACLVIAVSPSDQWPGFRGDGDSVSAARGLPTTWSETEHVAWRADLPGYGQSSPVVRGDRVFVTSVEGEMKDRLNIVAIDVKRGAQLWHQTFDGSQGIRDSDY